MAMTAALNFSGIAMFEFKRGPDGGWILLEVNARPWGSMPLPLSLGVEFPYRWFRQLTEGVATGAVAYRPGIYGRNLLPDLLAIATEVGRRRGLAARIGYIARHVWDMRRMLTGGEVQDVLARDDPAPAVAELRQFLAEAGRRILLRLPLSAALASARARRAVARAATRGGPILFVCQGNICRSPYAAAALCQFVTAEGAVTSAGLMNLPGRPSPAVAISAAARRGIDLVSHRSRTMTPADAARASLVVIFDGINASALRDQFPGLRAPVLRLGELTGAGDIADPVDGDGAFFDATYLQIDRAIGALVACLKNYRVACRITVER
jgi:protein-tyrosine-phosphatase